MLMIGIRQFFTRQNFPNPDSSKFSTVKILCHTVHGVIVTEVVTSMSKCFRGINKEML